MRCAATCSACAPSCSTAVSSRSSPPIPDRRGQPPGTTAAYGLRIEGLGERPELALRGAAGWPRVRFSAALSDEPAPPGSVIGEASATIVNPAATLLVEREPAEVRVRSPAPVPAADLIHPCLWPVAAVFARWRGAETLHAGAFIPSAGGGAWAVMADSGGGKTSFLAALALSGREVLADDLLVLEAGDCLAGPRALDLRPEVAVRLGLGAEETIAVRSTSRRRLLLPPAEARRPLDGFVELAWGEAITVQAMRPAEALGTLARHRRVLGLGAEFAELLALLERPVLRLRRPHGWASAAEAAERLLTAIAARSG